MNLSLLLPAALAALATLLLPLLIHLARRSEEQRTVFAALRWLRHKPRPRQRLRFDEWPLLLVRLLLLALLALFLARPVLSGLASNKPWQVVLPGVPLDQARKLAADGAFETRWLAPGFPKVGEIETGSDVPFPSLLRELDAQLPADTRLKIVAPEQLAGADAQRPRLSRAVEWRVVSGTALPDDAPKPPPPELDVRVDAADAASARWLRAVVAAWESKSSKFDAATDSRPASGTVLVWLSPQPLPASLQAWARDRQTAILSVQAPVPSGLAFVPVWRDAQGEPLMEAARWQDGRVLRFTRTLAPASMPELAEADFPQRLREILLPPQPPSRVFARDHAPQTGAAPYPQAPRDLQPWLALLVALLLLVERWLATSRRRGASP